MEPATVASFTAAGISPATLVVTTFSTGRRERLKWACEAPAEAYHRYVDVSAWPCRGSDRRLRAFPAGDRRLRV